MPDVFLSYSREDQATARRFAQALTQAGLEVWWGQTLTAGAAYDKVTEQALREAKAVVVLWSKHSVDSRWVRAEATIADRKGTLVPVMIEPCDRPVMFELTQTAELAHWDGDPQDPVWQAYLADLKRFVGKGGAAIPPAGERQASAQTPPVGQSKSRGWQVAIVAVVLLAVVAGAWLLLRDRGADGASAASAQATSLQTA